MKNLLRSIWLVVAAVVSLTVRAENEPKIFWGEPVLEWGLGISTTNTVFPQGVPPDVSLYLSNGASVDRKTETFPHHFKYKIVWSADSGEILVKTYPDDILERGGSERITFIRTNQPLMVRAWCGDLLARLPPGQGRLTAFRSVPGPDVWGEVYSGELVLHVRPRTESDPPPFPLRPTDKEIIAEGYARQRAAREATNFAASNSVIGPKSPGNPSTLIKSGTPSIGQKSGTSASPVAATVSAGDSPGSIFTPRNIIGATVVLGLLAIIASVLVRARSRQNSPP